MTEIPRLRVFALLIGLLTGISSLTAVAQPGLGNSSQPRFHPNRLILKPKRVSTLKAHVPLTVLHASQQARVLRSFARLGEIQVLDLPPGTDLDNTIDRYRRSGLVDYIERDYELTLAKEGNDPEYVADKQWALFDPLPAPDSPRADIRAPEGWEIRTAAPDVIVAVIDTGIRYSHEDLAANMWTNPDEIPGNGIDDDRNGYVDDVYGINSFEDTTDPMDDNGHGTHVAGIIGAVGNNERGVTGVAWQVKLMALKAFCSGGSAYDSDVVTCLDYARAHGAHVINCSWGTAGSQSRALQEAIGATTRAGIMVVAAAGNDARDVDQSAYYPACYPFDNIVTVAAITRSNTLASFSNYGQGSVALGAPGNEVLSTWFESDSAYIQLSGTSMATPMVSGVLALMRAQFPSENYLQLFNRVYAAADPVPGLAQKCRTGGRVNLGRALGSDSSRPGNDDFAARLRLSESNFTTKGINVDATREPAEPEHPGNPGGKSIWWSWRPDSSGVASLRAVGAQFQPLLSVYTGTTLTNLERIAANQLGAGGAATNAVQFNVDPAKDYAIAVDGVNGEGGSVLLNLQLSLRPANDHFTNGLVIGGAVSSVTSSNVLATAEAGEPWHGDAPSAHSVWWVWTAPRSGPASFSTSGSDFDTVLAVYTGATLSELTLVAANQEDPAGAVHTSRLTIDAVQGNAYHIAVDGRNGATGKIVLNTPPLNDAFADYLVLTGASCSTTAFNVLATAEPREPDLLGEASDKSLWWSWTAPFSGRVTVLTIGSTFDTRLGIYEGVALDSLKLIDANDNDPYGNFTSLATFQATANGTYYIKVDGSHGAWGAIRLTVSSSEYAITELTAPPGYVASGAMAINASGVVCGALALDDPEMRNQACIWTRSGEVQLICPGAEWSYANDINDLGQVVGFYSKPFCGKTAFIWQNGVLRDLVEGNCSSMAEGIDNTGRVVGRAMSANGNLHAFSWHNGVLTDLGAPAGASSDSYALNGPTLIVGQCLNADASLGWPVVWRNYTMENIVLSRPIKYGCALAANALSQVVGGYEDLDLVRHAFLWEDGKTSEFATGYANGINNLGQIVGWDIRGPEGQKEETAILWREGKATLLTDLIPPNSGWTLWWGRRISDWGQIVGAGRLNGRTRGFLMTPLLPPPPRAIIVSPADHETLNGEEVPIQVQVVPSATAVAKIDFFAGSKHIGSTTQAPFSFTWTGVQPGDYLLSAVTENVSGGTHSSQQVRISVTDPAVTDSDSDGIPDRWEMDHGLNPHYPADALVLNNGSRWCNLLEYAFGTEPGDYWPDSLSILDSGCLSIQFKRRKAPGTLQYLPEVSSDLQNWFSGSEHLQELAVVPMGGRLELVTVKTVTPAPAPGARFFRIRLVVQGSDL